MAVLLRTVGNEWLLNLLILHDKYKVKEFASHHIIIAFLGSRTLANIGWTVLKP